MEPLHQQPTPNPPPQPAPPPAAEPNHTPSMHPAPAMRPVGAAPQVKAKADLGKRFVAALIDGILVAVVGLIPVAGGIIGAAYYLLRDGLDLEFMDRRSIGKKVMKLRPIRLDGQPVELVDSVKRNIPLAIAPILAIIPILGWIAAAFIGPIIVLIEAILVLVDNEGRRIGDKIANTKVVESDD